jgi:hypothetical protein
MRKNQKLSEQRLSFAAGFAATLALLAYSTFQFLRESPLVAIKANSSSLVKTFLPLTIVTPCLMGILSLTFVLYLLCRGLRLCSSDLETVLDSTVGFLWNGGFFALTVSLVSAFVVGILLVVGYSVPNKAWGYVVLLTALGSVVYLALLTVRSFLLVLDIRFGWKKPLPRWANIGLNIVTFLVGIVIAVGLVFSALTWHVYEIYLAPFILALAVAYVVGPLERYLRLDGWRDYLGVKGKPSIVIVVAPVTLFISLFAKPLFRELQLEFQQYSAHLAVLRIHPRGFLDLGSSCYNENGKQVPACLYVEPVFERSGGSFVVDCFAFANITIFPLTDQKKKPGFPNWYEERPCMGSMVLGYVSDEEGPVESSIPRRLVTGSTDQSELDYWFDPTTLPDASWAYRATVNINGVSRSVIFPSNAKAELSGKP